MFHLVLWYFHYTNRHQFQSCKFQFFQNQYFGHIIFHYRISRICGWPIFQFIYLPVFSVPHYTRKDMFCDSIKEQFIWHNFRWKQLCLHYNGSDHRRAGPSHQYLLDTQKKKKKNGSTVRLLLIWRKRYLPGLLSKNLSFWGENISFPWHFVKASPLISNSN